MLKFASTVIIFIIVIINTNMAVAGDKEKKIMPKPVPVNLKPISYDESYAGIGYNTITALSEWKDSWLTGDEEQVGDIKYTVNNLAIGFVKSKSSVSTTEWDLLIGTVDFEQDTNRFHYNSLPGGANDMNVKASGSGFDIGIRMVSSRTVFHQKKADGSKFIDWNYAISYHFAYFTTDGSFEARSVDGQWGEAYDEEEYGIFFRPVIALQPIVPLTNLISVVPYIGLGTVIALSEYYWENTDYISFGSSQPGQFSDGYGTNFEFSGIETILGFDVGIITSQSKQHKLTLGGALSRLLAEDESSFTEVHALYSIPY